MSSVVRLSRRSAASRVSTLRALAGVSLAALALAGCGEEEQPIGSKPKGTGQAAAQQQPPPAAGGAQPGRPGAPAATSSAQALPPLPPRDVSEADLSESDRSRDPFRTYASLFVTQAKTKQVTQRTVLLEKHALEEIKLVGIITRGGQRALLTDPGGTGWVTKVGDFIGRSEIVHAGGQSAGDVALNWRIDRIREEDVVFVLEDASHPEIPPKTRVVPLHPPDTKPGL